MKKYITIIFAFSILVSFAQKPKARFSSDSISIGKPIFVSLTYWSRAKTDLLFPDSTHNFKPFEIRDIKYYPTKTIGGKSLDSVVYELVTFDVDSSYSLSLPVKILRSNKSIYSDTAYVSLNSSIKKQDLINPTLKKSTGYFNVPLEFNFPKLLYILLIFLISCAVFWIFFGKILVRNVRLWKFNQKQNKFTTAFKKLGKNHNNIEKIGSGLVLWKNHLEWLLKKPYSAMTTSEITKTLDNDRLEDALKEFDQAIYGGIISNHIPFAFNVLYDFAHETFKKQRKVYKDILRK